MKYQVLEQEKSCENQFTFKGKIILTFNYYDNFNQNIILRILFVFHNDVHITVEIQTHLQIKNKSLYVYPWKKRT